MPKDLTTRGRVGSPADRTRLERMEGLLETISTRVGALLDGQLGMQELQRDIKGDLEVLDQRLSTLEVRVMALARGGRILEQSRNTLEHRVEELGAAVASIQSRVERLRTRKGLDPRLDEILERQRDLEQRLDQIETA